MFKKKQAKKLIFASEIALRVQRSDLAQNPCDPADFLNAASSVVGHSATVEILNRYMGEAGGAPTNSTDDLSALQHDSQPWQNRIYVIVATL